MQNESMIFSFQKYLVNYMFLSAFLTTNINNKKKLIKMIIFSSFSYWYCSAEELRRAFIKS